MSTINEANKRLLATERGNCIRSAIKAHYSIVQPQLDSLTNLIYQELKEPFEAYITRLTRPEEKSNGGRVKCGVLIPAVSIRASDIAPEYDLALTYHWHLNIVVWYASGLVLNEVSYEHQDVLDAILRIGNAGISINGKLPSPDKERLVLGYIEKQNMVERFSILAPVQNDA